ncbi:MAG: alpha/beta fold hydrolase [Acidobacteriota bacterium]
MRYALALAAVLFAAAAVHAQVPKESEADFVVKDFRFRSGETLPEVPIHYATIGTLRRTERGTNAVLVLHGTGGSLRQFLNDRFAGVLFAPGGLLDASRFFIVIPDNVGHGRSSKPSDGLRAKFPHYDYDDMVELQHRLLTEALGVDHLFMVIGTSMGGMQSWMWGERWPDMMDTLVPLASLPAPIAGRNRVWRKMMIDDLRDGQLVPAIQILLLVGSSPLQWQKAAPARDDADRWLAEQMKSRAASTDADDLLYAMEASRNYDPSPQLERITAPLLAINSADDFINPPELGIMETAIKRVKRGRYVLLPVSDATRGHGTHTWAAVWEGTLREFLEKRR